MDVQYRFDDEVKDDAHGLPQFILSGSRTRWNRLVQKLVEKLVRVHTNLVLRESLDDTLRHLLPWGIDLVIDDPVDEHEEEPEVYVCIVQRLLIPT